MNRSVPVSGFQIFRDRTRKWRCYHRKTRHPIDLSKAPIGSAAFFAECERIRRIAQASEADVPARGTLGDLVQHYLESDRFRNLAPRTRADYRLCLCYLDAGRALAMDVRDLDTPALSRIHDAVADKHGWRRANMLLSVLSQVYRQAIPAGLAESNPARYVIPKRRPRDLPPANRPWTPEERDAVLERAAPHMRVALALMMLTGLDPSDAVRLRRDDIQDGTIWTERGKTGVRVAIPVMPRLREALDAARRRYRAGHQARNPVDLRRAQLVLVRPAEGAGEASGPASPSRACATPSPPCSARPVSTNAPSPTCSDRSPRWRCTIPSPRTSWTRTAGRLTCSRRRLSNRLKLVSSHPRGGGQIYEIYHENQ